MAKLFIPVGRNGEVEQMIPVTCEAHEVQRIVVLMEGGKKRFPDKSAIRNYLLDRVIPQMVSLVNDKVGQGRSGLQPV